MKIGDVSKRVGLPSSTIRYYEKIGLADRLPRVSGRRDFDEAALFALEFVKLAQSTGFSIEDIKNLMIAYRGDSGSSGAWTKIAERQRSDIRSKLNELSQMEAVLTELLTCSCPSFTDCIEKGMARNKASADAD
jgi:MerR family redox-sensitive transcriptional activator SoxR